jgi:uncharacterized membrane protein
LRKAAWLLLALLSVGVAAYAFVLFVVPTAGPPFVHELRARLPLALLAHVGASAGALALGPWQLSAAVRRRAPGLHRWMGRAYVVLVAVGGAAGVRLAFVSQAGWIAHVAFGCLGVLWLWTTAKAYTAARARAFDAHRDWMVRSFALALAAVMLRIYLPLALVAGAPFEPAYRVIAWMCWVPNLLVAEWIIRSCESRGSGGARVA